MKTKVFALIIAFAFVYPSAIFTGVAAETHYVIPFGGYEKIAIELGFGEYFEYDFSTTGARIDVLVMNSTFFAIYETAMRLDVATPIVFYQGSSIVNASDGKSDFRAFSKETYYLVFDNSGRNANGADASGDVEMSVSTETMTGIRAFQNEIAYLFTGIFLFASIFMAVNFAMKKLNPNWGVRRTRAGSQFVVKRTIQRIASPG